MKLRNETKGDVFILTSAVMWGFFPVITILSYNKLTPLTSLAGTTFFATLFFAVILSLKGKWHEVKNTAALKNILLVTLICGILYYLLFFFGLRKASAGNASIIAITEIFFSYLFFQVWKKDYFSLSHTIGAMLTLVGALIILLPKMQDFQGGEFLILIGAAIVPFGNYFQQKARKIVSSECMMFTRSLISFFVIILLVVILEDKFSLAYTKDSLFYLFINGIFLFGLVKILWIEGIHRISVTKANALSNVTPLFTLFFAWIFLKDLPTIWQVLSLLPLFLGMYLLNKTNKN